MLEKHRDTLVGFVLIGGVAFVAVAAVFPDWTASAEHLATVLGLFLGGGWAVYQFWLKRADETGLSIAFAARTLPGDDPLARAVTIEVTIKNTGNRRIVALENVAHKLRGEFEESVAFPGDLQIRRILPGSPAPAPVDWWDGNSRNLSPPLFAPINLLAEYTDVERNSDFFMEPGEEYTLGACVILEPGLYVAKVVFVGETPDSDYWSRIQAFGVPDGAEPPAAA